MPLTAANMATGDDRMMPTAAPLTAPKVPDDSEREIVSSSYDGQGKY